MVTDIVAYLRQGHTVALVSLEHHHVDQSDWPQTQRTAFSAARVPEVKTGVTTPHLGRLYFTIKDGETRKILLQGRAKVQL